MESSQRTGWTICRTIRRRISSGSSCGWASTLKTTRIFGRSHGHLGEGGGALLVGGPHDRRVEGPGHGQGDGLHGAQRAGLLGRPLARRVGPRNDDRRPGRAGWRFRRISPWRACWQRASTCTRSRPMMRDHAAGRGVGGLLHGRPAPLHQRQAVLEIHHAGEDHGRILAQAQAGGRFAGQAPPRATRPATTPTPPGWSRTAPAGCRWWNRAPRPGPRSRAWPGRSPAPAAARS